MVHTFTCVSETNNNYTINLPQSTYKDAINDYGVYGNALWCTISQFINGNLYNRNIYMQNQLQAFKLLASNYQFDLRRLVVMLKEKGDGLGLSFRR